MRALGYTKAEACFLYVVATHSGYLGNVNSSLSPVAIGASARQPFWGKLRTKKHARTEYGGRCGDGADDDACSVGGGEDCGRGAGAGVGARSDAGVCEGDGVVRGRLSRVQNSAAGGGTLYKSVGEPRNEGMGEAFFSHTALGVGNMVSELFCEFIYALNHGIGMDMQLFG